MTNVICEKRFTKEKKMRKGAGLTKHKTVNQHVVRTHTALILPIALLIFLFHMYRNM